MTHDDEIRHVLRHLARMRRKVKEKTRFVEPLSKESLACDQFLTGLKEVYDTTRKFRHTKATFLT